MNYKEAWHDLKERIDKAEEKLNKLVDDTVDENKYQRLKLTII